MKKMYFITSILLVFVIIFSFVNAEDTSLIKLLDKEKTKYEIKFQQIQSCEQFKKILKQQVKYYNNYNWGIIPLTRKNSVDIIEDTANLETSRNFSSNNQQLDFSKTNIQKEWVDEPEIIKNNWKIIFYYNQAKNKIFLIKDPIKNNQTDINQAQILNSIILPKNFSQVKLFTYKNLLIILATRYLDFPYQNYVINKNDRTSVAIYDTTNPQDLKLLKFYDIDWYLSESRINNGFLYTTTNVNFNRYWINQNQKILDKTNAFLPKIYWTDWNWVKKQTISCENMYFLIPSTWTLKKLWFRISYNLISSINLNNLLENPQGNIIFANWWKIHMSQKSLYFTTMIRDYWNYRPCPAGTYCIMPMLWENTLIHKFKINWPNLKYINSNLVKWSMLNQYSMDEDSWWNFRILTRLWRRQGTNFYVFDKNLNLKWKLEKIEPDEQFQSARYIWNKLYLSTFRAIDPIFVIDISDLSNPKIIWELKTPWYSFYLHPLKQDKNIQYLLWIWKNDKQNSVMVYIYKIDFDKTQTLEQKCWELINNSWEYQNCIKNYKTGWISISVIDSKIIWWTWSTTTIERNFRNFVLKSNELILPIISKKNVKIKENCFITKDISWNIIDQRCTNIYSPKLSFVWIKLLKIDINSWIKENWEISYLDEYKKIKINNYWNNTDRNLYYYVLNDNIRVWYIKDIYYFLSQNFIWLYNKQKRENKIIPFK